MRRHAITILLVSLFLSLAGCMKRASPADKSIETTFPSSATLTSLPRKLRMVTFNVHRETPANVIRAVRSDPTLHQADLILLQEVHRIEPANKTCSAACALGEELGMHTLYAPGHMQGTGSDGVAILSRAPILSGQVMELPDIDVHINSGRRVALVATLLVDGAPVTVYAVHLTNRLTVDERRVQMLPVLQHARKQETPVIIAGDFNTSPFTWLAGMIPIPTGTQDNRFEELVRDFGFDTPVKDVDATSYHLGMKLDAIYTRGFDTHRFDTATAAYVSDHLALWATVELRDPNAPAAKAKRSVATGD